MISHSLTGGVITEKVDVEPAGTMNQYLIEREGYAILTFAADHLSYTRSPLSISRKVRCVSENREFRMIHLRDTLFMLPSAI